MNRITLRLMDMIQMMVEKRENQRNTQSKRESAMNNWVGFFTQLLLVGLVTERKKKSAWGMNRQAGLTILMVKV